MKTISGMEIVSAIDKDKLDGEFYFQSLMEQAFAKEMLGMADIERLQYGCIELLAYKTEKFNGNDSSSIRVEKAQSIMASNLLTIGLYLKRFANPDDAVSTLLHGDMFDIYKKGRKRLDMMVNAARLLYSQLLAQLVPIPNVFYLDTVHGGITGFFKLYAPDFEAQELHITADYPTCNALPRLAGIEFMQAYIQAIYYENQFCKYFEAGAVSSLLHRQYGDYRELLLNLYEPVLSMAVCCTIAGRNLHGLSLSTGEENGLRTMLIGKPRSMVLDMVKQAAGDMCRALGISGGLQHYISGSLEGIAARLALQSPEI